MFERYTEKARRTIFFARYEASQFGSPYIEVEHLLLGLMRERSSDSSSLLPGKVTLSDLAARDSRASGAESEDHHQRGPAAFAFLKSVSGLSAQKKRKCLAHKTDRHASSAARLIAGGIASLGRALNSLGSLHRLRTEERLSVLVLQNAAAQL